MKDLRRIVWAILMLAVLGSFTGCTEVVEKRSPKITNNQENITVFSPNKSTIDIMITLSYGENKSLDIAKRIYMEEGETKILSPIDIDENIFTQEAVITSAEILEYHQSNKDNIVETIAIAIGGIFSLSSMLLFFAYLGFADQDDID